MSTPPVLDGIHHLKLPVTDLDRSLAWYQEHLGYRVMTEFVEDGVRMGVAMTHPNGGPDLALRCDPDRARAAAGFDYFSIGVPGHDPIEALAAHLAARGVHHDGVHTADAPRALARRVERHRHPGRVLGALIAFGSTPAVRSWTGQWWLPSRSSPHVGPGAVETVDQRSHTVLDHHGALSDDTTALLVDFR